MVQILLNGNVMNAARRAATRGEKIEYRDTLMPGLVIRVRSSTPYFYWLSKSKKLKIGAITSFVPDDLEMLRGLIPVLKNAHKEGENLNAIVNEVVLKGKKNPEDARIAAQEKKDVEDGKGWTFRMARDIYLENVKAENRKRSYGNDKSCLGCEEGGEIENDFRDLLDMPMKSIQVKDLSTVLKRIKKRVGDRNPKNPNAGSSSAIATYSGIQAVFKYATLPENSELSGLDQNTARMLNKPRKVDFDKNDPRGKASAVAILANVKQIRKLLTVDLWNEDVKEIYKWAIYIQACNPSAPYGQIGLIL
ncbi:MAG: hypothetical protein JJ858_18650 [Rhizobiaceae bacterium]|nr:hypothetical protein [Rhizobiaceae bacterium]